MLETDAVSDVLDAYHRYLLELDTWFRSVRIKYGDLMTCGKGCTRCCCGLFDISLPDALRVAAGFRNLPASVGRDITRRSSLIHGEILLEVSDLRDPFFLHTLAESDIDRLAERFDAVRCPYLGDGDDCLIYESRPLACILEGVPMVDASDGLFDDWCELNFPDGIDKTLEQDLQLDYPAIEAMVQRTANILREAIPAFPRVETGVFLPSVAVTFETFWAKLL
jgi:Fe-S-cluster containining protein